MQALGVSDRLTARVHATGYLRLCGQTVPPTQSAGTGIKDGFDVFAASQLATQTDVVARKQSRLFRKHVKSGCKQVGRNTGLTRTTA